MPLLGTVAYEDEKYQHTRDWMDETLKRLNQDNDELNLVNIYDYLAYSEYKVCYCNIINLFDRQSR